MFLMEFSLAPLDQGESVSDCVAESLKIIDHSGLDYQLHSMGTTIEGELDPLLQVLKQCFEALQNKSARITCTAKFDYRRGHRHRLASKVTSVEEKVGRVLKK